MRRRMTGGSDGVVVIEMARSSDLVATRSGYITHREWCLREVARMRAAGALARLIEMDTDHGRYCEVVREDNPLSIEW